MKVLKGYMPLCLIGDKVLLYRRDQLYLYEETSHTLEPVIHLRSGFKKRLQEKLRLTSRMFRAGIRSAYAFGASEVLFASNKHLYYASLDQRVLQELASMKSGFSDPLNLCAPLEEADHIALFGDYGNNPDRQPVSIYGVNKDLTVEVLHTFPQGSIRHIHNIIADDKKNGYYVFAGDNDPDAGIYWTDRTFNVMTPVLTGTQKGRAVCGFVTEKGLLFATDSISEQNHIYLLNEEQQDNLLHEVTKINGSCIYSTEYARGYVFSTTVESPETNGNRLRSLLSMKRGEGILSDEVHLVHVDRQFNTSILYKLKKDRLPYKLFQYGAVRFPSGLKDKEKIIAYPYAVEEFDDCTIFYEASILHIAKNLEE